MTNSRQVALAGLLALCACGGVGVAGDAEDRPAFMAPAAGAGVPPAVETFEAVDAVAYAGESATVTLPVPWTITAAARPNVAVFDRAGVIEPRAEVASVSDVEGRLVGYQATLQVSPELVAGTHTGSLELRLCLDDPAICAKPWSGSPWRVAYTVKVRPAAARKAVRALASAAPLPLVRPAAPSSS